MTVRWVYSACYRLYGDRKWKAFIIGAKSRLLCCMVCSFQEGAVIKVLQRLVAVPMTLELLQVSCARDPYWES